MLLGRVPKEDEGTLYSIFCQVPGAVCKDRLLCDNHKCYHFLFSFLNMNARIFMMLK